MKYIKSVFLCLLVFAMSCKNNNKASEESKTEQQTETSKTPIQTIKLPEVEKWKLNSLNLVENFEVFDNDTIYKMSRISKEKPAYTAISGINIFKGSDYEVSVKVKKGDVSKRFGLRIQSIYPNKMDAVFDLEKGEVIGSKFKGDFHNVEAKISSLKDGWYICSLRGEVLYDKVAVVFGPSNKINSVSSWESKLKVENDVYIIPNSLSLSEY